MPRGQAGETYPPFDLVQLDDNRYRINLAVASFRQDEIDVTAQQNLLIVSGRKSKDDGAGFIHRGIATTSFERRFGLADHVQVNSADLKDGMLSIDLVREIPEAMRPRKISLGGGEAQRLESERKTIEARSEEPVDA